MDRKIIWEKWYDIIPDSESKIITDEFDEDDEYDEDMLQEQTFGLVFDSQENKIRTPIGTFNIDEPLSPSNMYDCWVGHTNFRLNEEDYILLDQYVDGIEVIKMMSKYRFFIGIGKLFNFKDVQSKIQEALLYSQDSWKFNLAQDRVWSAFVGDDGTIKHVVKTKDMDIEEYQAKVEELKSLKNGSFITSIDV